MYNKNELHIGFTTIQGFRDLLKVRVCIPHRYGEIRKGTEAFIEEEKQIMS